MSKEIDFSKAPEGATHYRAFADEETEYYKLENQNYYFFSKSKQAWHLVLATFCEGKIHKIPHQWSIYNNTKPLKDLTDEQASELFRWRMSGGLIECYLGSGMAFFDKNSIYRAKKKSDRELFIEEAMRSVDLRGGDGEKDIYGKLFDSGKFKLVEQPK